MSFHHVSYEMRKRGYTFSLMILDRELAKRLMGENQDKLGTGSTVIVPMWVLREEADGSWTVVPGSEPEPTSEPVTIPKDGVKGMFKWPPEEVQA